MSSLHHFRLMMRYTGIINIYIYICISHFDLIHANHLQFSGPQLRALIERFFTICMLHPCVPKLMMQGVIKTVLKGNSICKANSENYRAVMNSSIFLKMLEYCLLPTLSKKLQITPLQFGFKEGSNCDWAIAMVKETIFRYKKASTNVHCAAIDLSKAYDEIN